MISKLLELEIYPDDTYDSDIFSFTELNIWLGLRIDTPATIFTI
jgi:hypothetical protein